MTAIAGIVQRDGAVLLGADGLACYGDQAHTDGLPKLFALGSSVNHNRMVIGVSGEARVAQALWSSFLPPLRDCMGATPILETRRYMVGDWIETYRTFAREHGLVVTKDGRELINDSRLLIGYDSRLFTITSDFSLTAHTEIYAAIGCAEDYVRGAIHAQLAAEADPDERDDSLILTRALEAAAHFDIHVRAPFRFETAERIV